MAITVSWSVINPWSRGDRDTAIKNWLHIKQKLEYKKAKPMLEGRGGHNQLAKMELQLLPNMEKGVFENQKKGINVYTMEINEFVKFKGIVDWHDDIWGLDWKFGKTPVTSIDKRQAYCYSLLLVSNGINNEYFKIVKVEKDGLDYKVGDHVTYIMNDRKREEAFNFIETMGLEIYQDLERGGLI